MLMAVMVGMINIIIMMVVVVMMQKGGVEIYSMHVLQRCGLRFCAYRRLVTASPWLQVGISAGLTTSQSTNSPSGTCRVVMSERPGECSSTATIYLILFLLRCYCRRCRLRECISHLCHH